MTLETRRGSALIFVLIISIWALVLIGTLSSLTSSSATSERTWRDANTMQGAVAWGIATAVNEINRHRLEGAPYVDPTAYGWGAMVRDPATGEMGVPVRDASGRVLARVRTVVRTEGTTRILNVVAAWPTFEAPRVLAGAEVELARGRPPFDRNALSIRGDADAGGARGVNGRSNQVDIVDPNLLVPAVNISDPSSYAAFLAELSGFGTVRGAHAVTGPGTPGTGADTTTQLESGILNQVTLERIAQGIDGRVDDARLNGVHLGANDVKDGATLATGTYYLDQAATVGNGATLRGSGTLVITRPLGVVGRLEWTGDIIIANEQNAYLNVDGHAAVDGILCVQGWGDASALGIDVRKGGRLIVGQPGDAGALALIGNQSTALLTYESGARLVVNGIMGVMGTQLEMDFSTGSELQVDGSLALVTPRDAPIGLDATFRPGCHMDIAFDTLAFDRAVDALGALWDPTGEILPVDTPACWEPPPRVVLARQEARLGPSPQPGDDYGMGP